MLQQIFNYRGTEVSFLKNDLAVYINATQMAWNHSKEVSQWFDNQSTHEFIHALADARGIIANKSKRSSLNASALAEVYPSLIKVAKGGTPGAIQQGTWMHEDVALEFARWLSPSFAIWCNDHIKQMLQTGQTSMGSLNEDQAILKAMQILHQRVETTTKQLELANTTIKHQAPKVNYYDDVLDSPGLISTTIIAKDLGMSAEELNRKLNQRGIIFKTGKCWVPYAAYQDKGYCKSKTYPYADSNGKIQTSHHFYWTEAGRLFLMESFKRHQL